MEGGWDEVISLARGVSADARGIADEARREYAREHAEPDEPIAPTAPADRPAIAGPPTAQPEDALPLRLLWLAGLVAGLVGLGAGMYWASTRRRARPA